MSEQQEVAAFELAEQRSRSSAFLTKLVEGQLAIALEAASMSPPRIAIAIEKLELAVSAMKKEAAALLTD